MPRAVQETCLLNPGWLTNAIYSIINSRRVVENGGKFNISMLPEIFRGGVYEYTRDDYEYILTMFLDPEIGLCFEVVGDSDGVRHFIVPEALPANQPDFGVFKDGFKLVFEYKKIPLGLMSRIIVDIHYRYPRSIDLAWKNGVIFKATNTKICICQLSGEPKVLVMVKGDALAYHGSIDALREIMSAVNDRYPEADMKTYIMAGDVANIYVDYDHVRSLYELYGHRHEYSPPGAEAMKFPVGDLLGIQNTSVTRDDVAMRVENVKLEAAKVGLETAEVSRKTAKTNFTHALFALVGVLIGGALDRCSGAPQESSSPNVNSGESSVDKYEHVGASRSGGSVSAGSGGNVSGDSIVSGSEEVCIMETGDG